MPGPRRSAKKAKERKISQKTAQVESYVERRGGVRPGAGRPVGTRSIAKRLLSIREITEDIIKAGKVPLRVMVNNMVYYDEQAIFLHERVEEALADNAKKFSPDQLIKAMELITRMGDARMKATQIASMAAPYLHPRLSSMEMNVHKHDKPKDLPSEQETSKFSDDFRQLRSQPYVIEQEVVDVDPEGEDA